jgi:hypothetical protein
MIKVDNSNPIFLQIEKYLKLHLKLMSLNSINLIQHRNSNRILYKFNQSILVNDYRGFPNSSRATTKSKNLDFDHLNSEDIKRVENTSGERFGFENSKIDCIIEIISYDA